MAVRHSPLVEIFDERGGAENAIEQLHDAGFNDDQICYSGNVSANTGGGGFLEAIKRFFTGDQTASSSDVAHELSNMGLSDDETDYYAQEYDAGRSVVAVNAGQRYEEALTILRRNGGHGYRSGRGYNQVGMQHPTEYDQTAAGARPENLRQSSSYDPQVASYNQQRADAGYNPQAAGYNEQPSDYAQGTNAAFYNQQVASSGYNPQAAGYNEQPVDYAQGTNAASYNQQAANAGYNPQAAGYNEQPSDYDQRAVNYADTDEERRRRMREERRQRENTVTDADTNP